MAITQQNPVFYRKSIVGLHKRNHRFSIVCQSVLKAGDTVLVAGGTGGTGQLTVQRLVQSGINVKTVCRKMDHAKELYSDLDNVEIYPLDFRSCGSSSIQELLKGVDAVCCCLGTTVFPSPRWNGNNGPKPTDYVAVKNLVEATPLDIKRFVLVTSAGVMRSTEFPWAILNWFGVLKYKRAAEIELIESGIPYTIVRPCRLIGPPYTNVDVNSRLQPSGEEFTGVQLSANDDIEGATQCARRHLVETIVQSLFAEETINKTLSICSLIGETDPEQNSDLWKQRFQQILV
eukprot:TRINITY_DN3961_c0_g2_i3.p1 TRINITY_DN3961_c0_g2~~TRINITY_DN3961_c0_g2_i3.p1  ORF type:complete len:289 (+),score=25.04 TRINITY_DN3961_c0_g2_i3:26-892(+)